MIDGKRDCFMVFPLQPACAVQPALVKIAGSDEILRLFIQSSMDMVRMWLTMTETTAVNAGRAPPENNLPTGILRF